jgi:predicted CoA-binding protein
MHPLRNSPRGERFESLVATTPEQVLRGARTIAVVGASRDPGKPGGSVPYGLQHRGFRIIPVNPFADELFGERAYRTLAEIPEPVDLVDVFRPAADAPDIARQAAAIGAKALWLQLDIRSADARAIAEAAGMDYVEDACTGVVAALHRITQSRAA